MDQEPNGAQVPFDMRLHVPPMAQTSYTTDHYHAMKRLVDEGYITIKPNARLRMGSHGVWEVNEQPLLSETTLRERSLSKACFTRDDNPPPALPGFLHDGRGPYLIGREPETQILNLVAKAKEVLMEKHDNAHSTWTILQEKLNKSSPLSWSEETLKEAIKHSVIEESNDKHAFTTSYAYGGSHLGGLNALIQALYHFCGCPKDEVLFSSVISEEDEGNEGVETERLNALTRGARRKDQSNAVIITFYVEWARSVRDIGYDCQDKLFNAKDIYNHLKEMIEERMLGDRMLQVIGITRWDLDW